MPGQRSDPAVGPGREPGGPLSGVGPFVGADSDHRSRRRGVARIGPADGGGSPRRSSGDSGRKAPSVTGPPQHSTLPDRGSGAPGLAAGSAARREKGVDCLESGARPRVSSAPARSARSGVPRRSLPVGGEDPARIRLLRVRPAALGRARRANPAGRERPVPCDAKAATPGSWSPGRPDLLRGTARRHDPRRHSARLDAIRPCPWLGEDQ